MKQRNTVSIGTRIPLNVLIEAKKFVAERPGLTLSKLYELSVQEYIKNHADDQATYLQGGDYSYMRIIIAFTVEI